MGRLQRKKAFTLIEVLVVVAIIALLMSILMPSLKSAREQSQTLVCKTRLRELYSGHAFYAADNRNHFPHWSWWLYDGDGHQEGKVGNYQINGYWSPENVYAKTGGERSQDSSRWVEYGDIYKYVKDKEAYFCPGDNKIRVKDESDIPYAIGSGGTVNNVWQGDKPIHSFSRIIEANAFYQEKLSGPGPYGISCIDYNGLQPGDVIDPDKLRPGAFESHQYPEVKTFQTIPSRVVLLFEEEPTLMCDGHSMFSTWYDKLTTRHRFRGNVISWDGHAELFDSRRWNNWPNDQYVLHRALGGCTPPRPVN